MRPSRPQVGDIFEDNDPTQRMMAIVNYNNDTAPSTGSAAVDLGSGFFDPYEIGGVVEPRDGASAGAVLFLRDSNDAYKLGVNYIVYGMTH